VVDGKDFDTFATSALALLATAVTPQLTAAAAIAKFVSRAIPQVLVRNRDDQVGLYYLSLNRMEHYPNGERKRDDVPDLSNNVRVDYSIFGTTYTVRRRGRPLHGLTKKIPAKPVNLGADAANTNNKLKIKN
jgi:hypothetical protein